VKARGWLLTRDGRYELVLKISTTTRLEIVPAEAPWNEAELGRFAAGIAYTGSAPQ